MPETTINIVVDKASKQKLQLTIKSSEANHSEINKWHVEFKMAVSKNFIYRELLVKLFRLCFTSPLYYH